MKCSHCGHDMADGALYCEKCGREIRIVPDYNPLEDVLEAHVKGRIEGTVTSLDDYAYASSNNVSGNRESEERKSAKRKSQRKRAAKKKRRKKRFLLAALFFLLAGILLFFFYQNSYAGHIRKGEKALQAQEYNRARNYYERAIKKRPKRQEAYSGLAKVYEELGEEERAEEVFLDAIDKYPNSAEIYEACFVFYIHSEKEQEISVLLEEAGASVRKKLKEYISSPPSFSLDDKETYDDVQQLTLTSKEEAIYYTTDGSEPSVYSSKYDAPIQIPEGTTEISAVSVNKKGIPSLVKTCVYRVEFPVEDAPAVLPSTGQYEGEIKISIDVPEGCAAYYTMDKSAPTEESPRYKGPIDMPEGTTIFKAVLVNKKGKKSGVTTRNYERIQN